MQEKKKEKERKRERNSRRNVYSRKGERESMCDSEIVGEMFV